MRSEALRAGLLLLLASALLLIAYQVPTDIFLDFGPNDSAYVTGFREDFEIDEPTLFHWSGRRGRVRLPFILPHGPLTLSFRYKRHIEQPAEINLFVNGAQVDRFSAPRQDFTVRTVTVEQNLQPWTALEISFLSRSVDPRPLGLALDWLQIEPSGVVLPTPLAFIYLLGLIAGLYVFPRFMGFTSRTAMGLAGGGAVLLAVWAAFHKLAPVHAAMTLGARSQVAILLVLLFCLWRGRNESSVFARPEARWALLAFYIGTTVRLLGLFHSEFYYPDIRTHSKFVYLIWTEGLAGFLFDHIQHQHSHLLGLQLVGERWLAFPYPPILYLTIYPLSLLQLPAEDWMKMVPTLLVGVEALFVYAIACRLGGSARAAAAASWFHATAPLVAFRLTVASYAAVFGHFWEMIVVLYLVWFFRKMDRAWVGLGLGILVAVSFLSYAGCVLVLGLFIPAFCLVVLIRGKEAGDSRRAACTALWALVGAVSAIALFYIQYIPELLPGGAAGEVAAGTPEPLIHLQFTPLAALGAAIHRFNLFYGPVFGLLFFVGLPWVRRQFSSSLGLPLAIGALFTFVGLNFLRSGLGETHIFQFTKDGLVLLPLFAIVLGSLVEKLATKGRFSKLVAVGLLSGWVGWGFFAMARAVKARFVRIDYLPAVSLDFSANRDENSEVAIRAS